MGSNHFGVIGATFSTIVGGALLFYLSPLFASPDYAEAEYMMMRSNLLQAVAAAAHSTESSSTIEIPTLEGATIQVGSPSGMMVFIDLQTNRMKPKEIIQDGQYVLISKKQVYTWAEFLANAANRLDVDVFINPTYKKLQLLGDNGETLHFEIHETEQTLEDGRISKERTLIFSGGNGFRYQTVMGENWKATADALSSWVQSTTVSKQVPKRSNASAMVPFFQSCGTSTFARFPSYHP